MKCLGLNSYDSSIDGMRKTAGLGIDFFNNALAVDLLSQIPPSERRPTDLANLGVALGRLGRYEEALQFTEAALKAELPNSDRALFLNNAAWFHLQKAQGAASVEEIADRISMIKETKQLLNDSEPGQSAYVLPHCLCTQAALLTALDDLDGAAFALDELKMFGPLKGRSLLVRAGIALKAQKCAAAEQDLKRALADLLPNSEDAKEAFALLTQIRDKAES